jgi:4-hydroxymandelate oxidase
MAKKEKRRDGDRFRPQEMLTVADLEKAARELLAKPAYDYFRSGADDETTLADNEAAYRAWVIWYRVLVDVARRELATTLLGADVATPIGIAPTAYHRMAHADGEAGTARAATNCGALMIVSTLATTSLEEVAAASTGPKWFQLYVHKDREFTRDLVQRAQASGYRALVLTADTPILGRRLRDVRNRFTLPAGLEMANLVTAAEPPPKDDSALAAYVAARHDASLTWRDVDWLASLTSLPIVIKGLVRRDDAERAIEHGARGVIVSNHGARQLDGAPATLDALPGVVEQVGARGEVYVDGGVRWGTDVLKAIALGARAVFVGRPILWGLAAGGQGGVEHVLNLLRDELSNAMALAGCASLADVNRGILGAKPSRA